MTNTLPYSYTVELSSLSEAGRDVDLSVPEGACREIASFYEVDGIEDFTAQFHLSRLAKNEYMLEGHFVARVLQTCIVTLGPIQTSLEQDFTRRYIVVPRAVPRSKPSGPKISPLEVRLGEDEVETLSGSSLDLAVPLLEELSLLIDPYPRSPGAEFGQSGEAETPRESPFSVLQALKDQLEPPEKT